MNNKRLLILVILAIFSMGMIMGSVSATKTHCETIKIKKYNADCYKKIKGGDIHYRLSDKHNSQGGKALTVSINKHNYKLTKVEGKVKGKWYTLKYIGGKALKGVVLEFNRYSDIKVYYKKMTASEINS